MSEKETLSGQIGVLVDDRVQQIPHPIRCTIKKIYNDNSHVDIITDQGVLNYVETISNNLAVGNTGVLIFLDNDPKDYIVLTK